MFPAWIFIIQLGYSRERTKAAVCGLAQLQKLEESWILTPHRKMCGAKTAWEGIGEGMDWAGEPWVF